MTSFNFLQPNAIPNHFRGMGIGKLLFLWFMWIALGCGCRAAGDLSQISFDDYEYQDFTIILERIDEKDGKTELLFKLVTSGGDDRYAWVRPDSKLEGYSVKLEHSPSGPVVTLLAPFPNFRAEKLVVGQSGRLQSLHGSFSLVGRGDVRVQAYVGETILLNDIKAEVRALQSLQAIVADSETNQQKIIPLSAISLLRAEDRKLRLEAEQAHNFLWRELNELKDYSIFVSMITLLIFNLLLVYVAILAGLLTLDKHPNRRRSRMGARIVRPYKTQEQISPPRS